MRPFGATYRGGAAVRRILTLALLVWGLVPLSLSTLTRAAATTDVSVVSADIRAGQRLAGACYVIVDWSNEGCDENGDGQVDFKDVRPGTYTVTQTKSPAGFEPVADFSITVRDVASQSFTARLEPAPAGRNVAIVS